MVENTFLLHQRVEFFFLMKSNVLAPKGRAGSLLPACSFRAEDLRQWSPIFLALGAGFLGKQFSRSRGG